MIVCCFGGMGIGFVLSYKFVELMGGCIEVNSVFGVGLIFVVMLLLLFDC